MKLSGNQLTRDSKGRPLGRPFSLVALELFGSLMETDALKGFGFNLDMCNSWL